MDKKQNHTGKNPPTGKNILSLPGIIEAMDLVRQFADVNSIDDAIREGMEGNFGEEASRLIKDLTDGASDKFLGLKEVEIYLGDTFDEWLEVLALAAGPKIAELWSLSEAAGRYLSHQLYWGQSASGEEGLDYSPVLIVNITDIERYAELEEHFEKQTTNGGTVVSPEQMIEGHIYLDVTELPYKSFRSTYKHISLCRKYIGIEKKDIKVGSPGKIDIQRAIEAAYLKSIGETSKSIAGELGFKIYTSDNPSGSYSLLHKYIKLGKEVDLRLRKLDQFLSAILSRIDA